jgi:hypothetical protein
MASRSLPGFTVSEIEKPNRTWQDIAQEAGREHDPKKLLDLSEELERALDERAKALHARSSK